MLTWFTALAFAGLLLLLDPASGWCVEGPTTPVYSVSSPALKRLNVTGEKPREKLQLLTCESAKER